MSLSDLIQEHKSVFVREVSYDEIKPFILKIHYARRMPCVTHSFGLFKDNELIGVVTYGIPASNSLCRGIAGDKNRYNVYELNRLVILPKYNGNNYASILVGRSLRMMPRRSFIVSYADTGWGACRLHLSSHKLALYRKNRRENGYLFRRTFEALRKARKTQDNKNGET